MMPLTVFVASIALVFQTPQRSTRSSESARFIHGALVAILSNEPAMTQNDWIDLVKRQGLKPFANDSGMWHLSDTTGDVRAEGFFLSGETTFYVFFFPSEREPIPDPLLRQLLDDASSTSLVETRRRRPDLLLKEILDEKENREIRPGVHDVDHVNARGADTADGSAAVDRRPARPW
jgi:hypothetical protein